MLDNFSQKLSENGLRYYDESSHSLKLKPEENVRWVFNKACPGADAVICASLKAKDVAYFLASWAGPIQHTEDHFDVEWLVETQSYTVITDELKVLDISNIFLIMLQYLTSVAPDFDGFRGLEEGSSSYTCKVIVFVYENENSPKHEASFLEPYLNAFTRLSSIKGKKFEFRKCNRGEYVEASLDSYFTKKTKLAPVIFCKVYRN